MSGFNNTNTHETTSASHGNPISNTIDALNPKTGSGVGSHGANTTAGTGYNNDSSLTGNHSTTGNPSHFQSTVASNSGNQTSSHNPLSSHTNNNSTSHSGNPLTHGTGTGYGTSSSTGNHGSAINDLNPTTGTGSHLPSSHHDDTGAHNLTSSGVPGSTHNNQTSRPGHGLDTSAVVSDHHSRADPHHDSSIAGSAGAQGLSLEQSRANAGGVTYPGESHSSVGTGPGAGLGLTGANHGVDSTHKPTITEKVKGTVETLVGKATHNPAKVAEGEALKTGDAHGTGTGVGGTTHSSTTGTGTHNTTGAGAHNSSVLPGHTHTGINDSDTFHNKHEGFAKEHNKDVSHGGSTLAGSGTGL